MQFGVLVEKYKLFFKHHFHDGQKSKNELLVKISQNILLFHFGLSSGLLSFFYLPELLFCGFLRFEQNFLGLKISSHKLFRILVNLLKFRPAIFLLVLWRPFFGVSTSKERYFLGRSLFSKTIKNNTTEFPLGEVL